jgi:hypothetical protein
VPRRRKSKRETKETERWTKGRAAGLGTRRAEVRSTRPDGEAEAEDEKAVCLWVPLSGAARKYYFGSVRLAQRREKKGNATSHETHLTPKPSYMGTDVGNDVENELGNELGNDVGNEVGKFAEKFDPET